MKLKIDKDSLSKALGVAYLAIDAKPIVPIWACFYFDIDESGKMKIYGRGSQMQIRTMCKVETDQEGTFVAPAQQFYDTIKLLKCKEVELTIDENDSGGKTMTLKVVGQRKKYKINSYDPKDFSIEDKDDESIMYQKLHAKTFTEAMSFCATIVKKEDLRKTFSGVSVRMVDGELEVSGTDAHMLARYLFKTDVEIEDMVVSKKTASVLRDIYTEGFIEIKKNGNYIVITDGSVQINSVLVDTVFPKVKQFWSEERPSDKFVLVKKEDIMNSIRVINLFAKNQYKTTKFFIEDNDLIMTCESESKDLSAEEVIEVQNNEVDNIEVGYNTSFMQSLIDKIDDDIVKLVFCGNKKPIFIEEPSINEDVSKSFLLQAIHY
jgi:DNA polymerase III sliding clamp (beta) subunit (PCNA family)